MTATVISGVDGDGMRRWRFFIGPPSCPELSMSGFVDRDAAVAGAHLWAEHVVVAEDDAAAADVLARLERAA